MFSINNSLSFQLLVLQAKITHVVEYSVSHICDKKKKEKKKEGKEEKRFHIYYVSLCMYYCIGKQPGML